MSRPVIRSGKLSPTARVIIAVLGVGILIASSIGIERGTTDSSMLLFVAAIGGVAIGGIFLTAAARGEALRVRRSRRRHR